MTELFSWRRPGAAAGAALLAAALNLLGATAAQAQFAAAVSPPRFEIAIEPGKVTRQVLEVAQGPGADGNYRVYTTDWTLDADGAVTYFNTPQPGSCRPWVTIERRELPVSSGARVRFRFEVAPPADTAARECRFALMFESHPQDVKTGDTASFPMNGRVAVIVYVRIGDALPRLEGGALSVGTVNGLSVPMVSVTNHGIATGRAAGVLSGVDAAGTKIEFAPQNIPILPGQTRLVALQPYDGGPRAAASTQVLKWPVTLSGTLEYGPGTPGRFEVKGVVAAPATP